jgi:DNA-binding CsgD family transcriptional regulator
MLPLNDQEQAIIELVCKGKSNQDVAQIMALGKPTVAGKLRVIYAKLDAHNRAEACANYVKKSK